MVRVGRLPHLGRKVVWLTCHHFALRGGVGGLSAMGVAVACGFRPISFAPFLLLVAAIWLFLVVAFLATLQILVLIFQYGIRTLQFREGHGSGCLVGIRRARKGGSSCSKRAPRGK